MEEQTGIKLPTKWCFVSYVFYLEGDDRPAYGNLVIQMDGHIADDTGFLELNKAVTEYIEHDVKERGKTLRTAPVILNFKEM